jgi:hypothetical protein
MLECRLGRTADRVGRAEALNMNTHTSTRRTTKRDRRIGEGGRRRDGDASVPAMSPRAKIPAVDGLPQAIQANSAQNGC